MIANDLQEKLLKAITTEESQNMSTNETIVTKHFHVSNRNRIDNNSIKEPEQQIAIDNIFTEKLISDVRTIVNGCLAEKYSAKLNRTIEEGRLYNITKALDIQMILADMAYDIGISRDVIADVLYILRADKG